MEHALRAVGARDGSPVLVNRKQPATRQTPKQASARLIQGPVPIAAKQRQSVPTKFGSAACPTVVRIEKLGAVIDEEVPAMRGDAGMLPSVMKALDTLLPLQRETVASRLLCRRAIRGGAHRWLSGRARLGSGMILHIGDRYLRLRRGVSRSVGHQRAGPDRQFPEPFTTTTEATTFSTALRAVSWRV